MATPAVEIPRTRPSLRGLRALLDVGNGFTPYFLILPTVLVALAVAVYPVLNSFWFSFLNGPPGPSTAFVGWSNYVQTLASSDFHNAISTTLIFTTISVTLETIFGLGVALLLHSTFPGRSLVQASVLIPWAFPTIVAFLPWLSPRKRP